MQVSQKKMTDSQTAPIKKGEALRFVALSLAYGSRVIFSNFNATIRQGEFIAILGANGAGKSTLLRAILGLVPSQSGQIRVFGKKPVRKGSSLVGYMPQTRQPWMDSALSAYAWLSAQLNGFKWGIPWLNRAQKQEIDRVVALVNAEPILHKAYALLSGGERQRLLLAQALLNRPQLLLLDEPLMNLDPYYQETLVTLVNRIRLELGITILLTSHDINPLLSSVSRVLYLAKGNAALGSVAEVITSQKLSELYNRDIQVIEHEKKRFVVNKETGISLAMHHCKSTDYD